jgi:hypothetical protein
MSKSSSPKVPKYLAAVAWLLESYATDAAIDAAAGKFLTAKQQAGEGEDAFATRLRRYAAEAGNVYKEDSLVSRYLAGLAPYTANKIRGHVSPCMRFTLVNNLAIQAGLAGREAGVSTRSSTRTPVPGLLTPRPRGVVALYRVFLRPVPSPSPIRTTWTRPWWPPQSMRHTNGLARNCLGRPRMFLVPPGVGLVSQRPRGTNLRWQ